MASKQAKLAYLATYYRLSVTQQRKAVRSKASRKTQRIFKGSERADLVDACVKKLSAWKASVFEHEATCRFEIRSRLCLSGHGWVASDDEAALLVSEALVQLGAVRPNWEQGQRDYADSKDDCAYCGGKLPDYMRAGKRQGRYCSTECVQRDRDRRQAGEKHAFMRSSKAVSGSRQIKKESRPLKTCEHCGIEYQPFSGLKEQYDKQRFCSSKCMGAARTTHHPQDCARCGQNFRPSKLGYRYCSFRCSRSDEMEKRCRCCSEAYYTSSHKSLYCSNACRLRVSRSRRREPVQPSNVIYLTAEIFDSWFRRAA